MTSALRRNDSKLYSEDKNTTVISVESLPIFQPLYSDQVLVAFTVSYTVIFLVGVIGNLLTCLVVLTRQYVHSQTPFYLNLAFSDLLLLAAGLPIDVYFFWFPFRPLGGTWFCIFRAIVTEAATNASILTIIVFTAERWISICHPGKSASNFPNSTGNGWRVGQGKSGKYVIMLIWLTAVLAALPLSAQVGLVAINDPQSTAQLADAAVCHIVPERAIPYSFEASSVIFFVAPMILITGFYSSIIIELRRTVARQSSINDSPLMQVAGKARQQAKASAAIVKILIAVVVAFFICFLPHHLQRLSANYVSARGDPRWVSFSQLLFTISGLFYYISTTVNPVIYCLLSKRFRFALRNQLFCRRRRRKNIRQNFSNDPFLNQLNKRALLIKANTYQNGFGTAMSSKNRIRYPASCPLAKKHRLDVSDLPAAPPQHPITDLARPNSLSVSSVYSHQNQKLTPKVSFTSSPCGYRSNLLVTPRDWRSAGSRWDSDAPNWRSARNVLEEHCRDCYNVFYDGDKLVISFGQSKPLNSI